MDETWILLWQSAEWTAAGESHPKSLWMAFTCCCSLSWLPKLQTSAGKVLTSVFWDAQSILLINYLEKGRIINSEYYIALLVHLKEEIPKNPALSPRQCTMSRVDHNDSKTTWIALQIAFAPTLFSRSGPQRLLAVFRPQKNAPGKEIWLQWRSDIENWDTFWDQRQIVLQKRHQIVWEALELVYHPRTRLCWWIKSNFA